MACDGRAPSPETHDGQASAQAPVGCPSVAPGLSPALSPKSPVALSPAPSPSTTGLLQGRRACGMGLPCGPTLSALVDCACGLTGGQRPPTLVRGSEAALSGLWCWLRLRSLAMVAAAAGAQGERGLNSPTASVRLDPGTGHLGPPELSGGAVEAALGLQMSACLEKPLPVRAPPGLLQLVGAGKGPRHPSRLQCQVLHCLHSRPASP